MTDFTDYKTASRLSPQINAGASARLNLLPMVSDLSGEAHAAFCHGWRTTDEAERMAGRPTLCLQPSPDAPMQAHEIIDLMARMGKELRDPFELLRSDKELNP